MNKERVQGRSYLFVFTGVMLCLKEASCLQDWFWADFNVSTNELGTKSRSVQ